MNRSAPLRLDQINMINLKAGLVLSRLHEQISFIDGELEPQLAKLNRDFGSLDDQFLKTEGDRIRERYLRGRFLPPNILPVTVQTSHSVRQSGECERAHPPKNSICA